jgi:hypothetical protein
MTPIVLVPAAPTPSADGSAAPPDLDGALWPDLDAIVTQDGTPMENIWVEKQLRLFTEPLYSSWPGPGEGRPFLALANVGLFAYNGQPPLAPDGLLALDVAKAEHLRAKDNRSYFTWIIGKPPDAVIEVVSDRRGGEDSFKMNAYARIGVLFYVLYDPDEHLRAGRLRAFVLTRGKYEPTDPAWFPEVGLGVKEWTGVFEKAHDTWLRWCDREGRVIPTGAERAEEERQRAQDAERRADETAEKVRRLTEQLRQLGAEPEA